MSQSGWSNANLHRLFCWAMPSTSKLIAVI